MHVFKSFPIALSVFVTSVLACSADATQKDTWAIWLTTDAPVPSLVDHARLELLDEAGKLACATCMTEVTLPTGVKGWPIILPFDRPATLGTIRVRVRLYRAASTMADGTPSLATTLDRIGILPDALGETLVNLSVYSECLGLPASPDTHQTCSGPGRAVGPEVMLDRDTPVPTFLPGSWDRARLRTCADDPLDGTLCLPGGFFVLGAPNADPSLGPTSPERYVAVGPVFLDIAEMTVGAVRSLVKGGSVAGEPTARAADPTSPDSACTYLGPDDPANDAMPLNCVTHTFAEAVCRAISRRLPTETELEWAAGNRQGETEFPWGADGDPCDRAAVGRGRDGFTGEDPSCRSTPGHAAAGVVPSPSTDQTKLGIVALGGGLAEWTADGFARYDADCWTPNVDFLVDPPQCDTGMFAVRGSSWADPPKFAASIARRPMPDAASPAVGFRCARSAIE